MFDRTDCTDTHIDVVIALNKVTLAMTLYHTLLTAFGHVECVFPTFYSSKHNEALVVFSLRSRHAEDIKDQNVLNDMTT